jgi:methylmalonyl-CoA epimerase
MNFVRRVERVALAVEDLDQAQAFFEQWFDARFCAEEHIEDMGIRYRPFDIGTSRMELLQATRPDSPVAKFLRRNGGPGVHHITFEVDDLDAAVGELERRGGRIAFRHTYAPGVTFEGQVWREAFVHPKDAFGVLIHLAETRPVDAAANGRRVSLVPTTVGDLPELLALWNDGRVMRWVKFPDGLGYDLDQMHAWLAAVTTDPHCHHFVVRAAEAGFCGEAYYAVDAAHRRAALDIKFTVDAQGKGLATDALETLIAHVFRHEPLVDSVWTEPWDDNTAAQRLYSRCGLQPGPRPADLPAGPSYWALSAADWRARN